MSRDDFSRWLSANAVKLLAYAVAVGSAWGILTAAVREKPSRDEVSALRDTLRAEIHTRDTLLLRISKEVRTIRLLLCDQQTRDSYCRNDPDSRSR